MSTAEEGLQKLKEGDFDCVISLLRVGGKDVFQFLTQANQIAPAVPLLLLASNGRELTLLDKRVDELGRLNINKRLGWETKTASESSIWTWPFIWQGDVRLLMAMVKAVEDRINCKRDLDIFKDLQIILFIEDSVQFYSTYLPVYYALINEQTEFVLAADNCSKQQKLARFKARPKVLLATSFDEAKDIYDRYARNILCIITDGAYPKDRAHNENAGLLFVEMVRAREKADKSLGTLPILYQSVHSDHKATVEALECTFVSKNSLNMVAQTKKFTESQLGFGNFLFSNKKGTVLMQANNLRSFVDCLSKVPAESLLHHTSRNDVSKWLRARNEYKLVSIMKSKQISEFSSVEEMRNFLITQIENYRTQMSEGTITDFRSSRFDPSAHFVRFKNGSFGGKGRGLAFMAALLKSYSISKSFPGFQIFIPQTFALTTEVFSEFMNPNLFSLAIDMDTSNEVIEKAFLQTQFPVDANAALRQFLRVVTHPIAVRSSSLFEDAFFQPFAGVYKSFMLPNNSPDIEVRLDQLVSAVKLVYASLFSRDAKIYAASVNYRHEDLKMAVLIQQIVGCVKSETRLSGSSTYYFYPTMSGVARSINFYPSDGMVSEDGLCCIALGMGESVVAGHKGVTRFSPCDPPIGYPYISAESQLKNSQKRFQCLDMSRQIFDSMESLEELVVSLPVEVAEKHGSLIGIGSAYVSNSSHANNSNNNSSQSSTGNGQNQGMIVDDPTQTTKGPRIITFHGVLKPQLESKYQKSVNDDGLLTEDSAQQFQMLDSLRQLEAEREKKKRDAMPIEEKIIEKRREGLAMIPKIVSFILRMASKGINSPVEIEFAVDLATDLVEPHRFAIVQCRPMALGQDTSRMELSRLPPPASCILASKRALGHGRIGNCCDIVMVFPSALAATKKEKQGMYNLLEELFHLNKTLKSLNRPYILIGPGRWGMNDASVGIPVTWQHVSGAAMIVDWAANNVFDENYVMPSEGAHFFQNISAFGIRYLCINPPDDVLDVDWIASQAVDTTIPGHKNNLVKVIHLQNPLEIVVDGVTRCGVIMKPSRSFSVEVEQVESFLSMSKL